MRNILSFLRVCLTAGLLFLVFSGMPLRSRQKSNAQIALELVAKEALKNSWSDEAIQIAAYALGATFIAPITDTPSKDEMLEIMQITTQKIIEKRNQMYQTLATAAPHALAAQQQEANQQAMQQQQREAQQQTTQQQSATQQAAVQEQATTNQQYEYTTDPNAYAEYEYTTQ